MLCPSFTFSFQMSFDHCFVFPLISLVLTARVYRLLVLYSCISLFTSLASLCHSFLPLRLFSFCVISFVFSFFQYHSLFFSSFNNTAHFFLISFYFISFFFSFFFAFLSPLMPCYYVSLIYFIIFTFFTFMSSTLFLFCAFHLYFLVPPFYLSSLITQVHLHISFLRFLSHFFLSFITSRRSLIFVFFLMLSMAFFSVYFVDLLLYFFLSIFYWRTRSFIFSFFHSPPPPLFHPVSMFTFPFFLPS